MNVEELQTVPSLTGLHSLTGSASIWQVIYVFTLMTKTYGGEFIGRSEMRLHFEVNYFNSKSEIIKNNKLH